MNRIIEKFLKEKGYRERKDILGIILYGSSAYHTSTRFSDIDLLIITENDKNYKGLTYIEDKNGNRDYHSSDANYYNKPLVILVNGNSASASGTRLPGRGKSPPQEQEHRVQGTGSSTGLSSSRPYCGDSLHCLRHAYSRWCL